MSLKEFASIGRKGTFYLVIIGAVFKDLVTSFTDNIIMPIVNIFTGSIDFSSWKIQLPSLFGEKVNEPVVEEGQADVIIAFERLEALRYAHFLKKDGVLVINDCRIDPMTVVIGAKEYPENIIENLKKSCSVYAIDAEKIAIELGNSKVLNSAVLGYAARYIGFDKERWEKTVEATVPPKTIEINKKAFDLGYEA